MTGIFKSPCEGAVRLGRTGPQGDGQADLKHHGGPDKAVCVYSQEHYPQWEQQLGRQLGWGAFGENLTLSGMDEASVVIGDRYRCGEALLEVSQPRQPCFKLGLRHAEPKMTLWVQESGRTGFYLRVVEEGEAAAGMALELVHRPEHGMTVAEANRIYYTAKKDARAIRSLLAVPELADSWRNALAARLEALS
ncbi:MOSC domain-containing protein [Paenibacillus albicereus]|uniref:MOSC domain-containing protein n=2 Tax=Paenibacillus albicereus TaxID=2726185 RepID=A0A6H2H409_9BACL|nr:MOSC domain-containing protein [Paenibacillus albicereus]